MKVLIVVSVILVKLSLFPFIALADDNSKTLDEINVEPLGMAEKKVELIREIGSQAAVGKESNNEVLKNLKDNSEKTTSNISKSESPISELPTVVLTLFLLIIGIFALAWLARRYGTFGLTKGNRIEVKSSIPVGARERVSLIEVDGQKLLIGVTGQQVSLLHTFGDNSEEAINPKIMTDNTSSKVKSPFAEKLKSVMQNKTNVTNRDTVTDIDKRAE